jgi:hypothetical protein
LGEVYLDRAGAPPVQAPEVVEVEANEAEDGDVEEDLPAAHDAAVAVEPLAQLDQERLARHEVGGPVPGEEACHIAELEPLAQFVGKQDADSKRPCYWRDILLGQICRELVVDGQDEEDLGR